MSRDRATVRPRRPACHYRAGAMAGDAMTGPLAAWPYLAALLAVGAALLRAAARADKREEAFTWTADDARRASARAEAATRWTWQEWRDELGTDFWTDEREDVA